MAKWGNPSTILFSLPQVSNIRRVDGTEDCLRAGGGKMTSINSLVDQDLQFEEVKKQISHTK